MATENDPPPNLIASLYQHGIGVFGTEEKFTNWLEKEHFFFDKKPPVEFIYTDEGLKLLTIG